MAVTRPGWCYAPDAYRSLGGLTVLAGGLPQALQQIITALRHELELNLIRIDPGTPYADDPAAAIDAASVALERPPRQPISSTEVSLTPRSPSTPSPTPDRTSTRVVSHCERNKRGDRPRCRPCRLVWWLRCRR